MLRCFLCDGRSSKGVHDVCWKKFTGFMLSDRISFDIDQHDETGDEPNQPYQGGTSAQGPTDAR